MLCDAEMDAIAEAFVASGGKFGAYRFDTLQAMTKLGSQLVVPVPFGDPSSRLTEFWTGICSPTGDLLAFVRMERRLCLNQQALFAAVELRLATPGDQPPEPFLQGFQFLPQGGL